MSRPTNYGLVSKSKLTDIADEIRRLLNTTGNYTLAAIAAALEGITRRTSSGNTPLNRSTIAKIFPAGYYPYEHTVAHTLGTEGAPTASKSISNHVATVTPSVTNTEGYIAGGTKSGTAVTVSASDLGAVVPSGNKAITSTAQTDVSGYATAQVNDANLVAANIAKDVTILGITGTHEGAGITGRLKIVGQSTYTPSSNWADYSEYTIPFEASSRPLIIALIEQNYNVSSSPFYNSSHTAMLMLAVSPDDRGIYVYEANPNDIALRWSGSGHYIHNWATKSFVTSMSYNGSENYVTVKTQSTENIVTRTYDVIAIGFDE